MVCDEKIKYLFQNLGMDPKVSLHSTLIGPQ